MPSRVNVGQFRDSITIYYVNTRSVTAMGDEVLTYTSYVVWADVNQINSTQSVYLGLNKDSKNYSVRLRPPASGRPVKILYNSVEYSIVSDSLDKVNQFLTLTVTNGR